MSDWIENFGSCPVDEGTLVDVKYRDGEILEGIPALKDNPTERDADYSFWKLEGMYNDIVQWRLHDVSSNDGWIKWTGGECPVDGDTLVEVELDDGYVCSVRKACALMWDRCTNGSYSNITKYRVVGESKKENNAVRTESSPKDSLGIFYDNLTNLSKAIRSVGGDADLLIGHVELLKSLARNGIELNVTVHGVSK